MCNPANAHHENCRIFWHGVRYDTSGSASVSLGKIFDGERQTCSGWAHVPRGSCLGTGACSAVACQFGRVVLYRSVSRFVGFNRFEFRGIDEGALIIKRFVLGGDYIVLAGNANGGVTPPNPTAVPEPATMTLLGTGLAGFIARQRRRRRSA